MNAQELRNLQETYMEVVENYQQLDRTHGGATQRGPIGTGIGKDLGVGFEERNKKRFEERNKKKKKTQKEQTDLYDIILSYLLDEGYAETPEAAESIMVNMSEDWRESICEGMKPLPVEKMDAKAKELKSKFRKSKVGTPEASKLLSRLGHIVAARDSKVG